MKRPPHYKEGEFEPIKIIQHYDLNFSLGNVIKYVLRAGKKGPAIEDLKKARNYLDFEIEKMMKDEN